MCNFKVNEFKFFVSFFKVVDDDKRLILIIVVIIFNFLGFYIWKGIIKCIKGVFWVYLIKDIEIYVEMWFVLIIYKVIKEVG